MSMCKFTTWRKKAKGNIGESAPAESDSLEAAKLAYEKATQAVDAVKVAITTEGAKAFKLYGNLLSDEARQHWEKIIQAQKTKCPWEDIFKVTQHNSYQNGTPVTFHLQQVFRHDAGEALKYYIMNTLRIPNQIPFHQFLV